MMNENVQRKQADGLDINSIEPDVREQMLETLETNQQPGEVKGPSPAKEQKLNEKSLKTSFLRQRFDIVSTDVYIPDTDIKDIKDKVLLDNPIPKNLHTVNSWTIF